MIPDEEPKAAPQTADSGPPKGRRRSRRGGRRHSKRRPAPASTDSESSSGPVAATDETEAATSVETASDMVMREESPRTEAAIEPPAPERHYEARQAETRQPGVTQAIEQVTRIIDELKVVLDEMEEVLETLELAERQKIDDEREIDALQRALRHLHRPAHGSASGHRH